MTSAEIEEVFGREIARIVSELTDDPDLPRDEQIRQQIEKAPTLSERARLVKLADQTAIVREIGSRGSPWSPERTAAYLDKATAVAAGCHGVSAAFDEIFARALEHTRKIV